MNRKETQQFWIKYWIIGKGNDVNIEDRHHITPISLYWHDLPHNIETIWRPAHNRIHEVLNIPYARYSRFTREVKKKTNHKLIQTVQFVDDVIGIQKEYFEKVYELPIPIINIHERKIRETLEYYNSISQKMWLHCFPSNTMNVHKNHQYIYEERRRQVEDVWSIVKKHYHF